MHIKPDMMIYIYIRLLQEACSSGQPKSDTSCKKPRRRSRFLQDLVAISLARLQDYEAAPIL